MNTVSTLRVNIDNCKSEHTANEETLKSENSNLKQQLNQQEDVSENLCKCLNELEIESNTLKDSFQQIKNAMEPLDECTTSKREIVNHTAF